MNDTRPNKIGMNYLRLSFFLLIVFWTVVMSASLVWNYVDCQERYGQLASLMADAHFDKEKALRLWVASKGGVYVAQDENNRPNPLLDDIKGRDIITSDMLLTLIPGFHLVRQLQEQFPELYKVRGDTVSLNPLRTENAPDDWQRKALESFQAGHDEFKEFTTISGEPYFRLMRPHYAQMECLKCHEKQGYVEGDILGGVEVSLPLREFLERHQQRSANMLVSHGVIFAVGLIGIIMGMFIIDQKQKDRDEVQIELVSSEEKYRHLVEGATDIIYQIDCNGSFTFLNSGVVRVFGYSEAELLGKNYIEFVCPEHRQSAKDFWDGAIENNIRSGYFECPFLSKDGRQVWLGQNVQSIVIGGELSGFQAIARDMTERRKMEVDLKTSEHRYRSLYTMIRLMCDNVPDLIWAKDLERKFLFVNRAVCEKLLIATDTDEPVGKTDMFFVERQRSSDPDNAEWHTFGEICIDSDQAVMETQRSGRFEEFGNVKGQFLYLDVYKTPLFNDHGKMIGTVGCARDVTIQKYLERTLIESEQKYRTISDFTYDWEYWTDPDGKFLYVSPSCERITGYSVQEFLDVSDLMSRIVHPDDLSGWSSHMNHCRISKICGQSSFDFRIIRRDGEIRWICHECQTVVGKDGNPMGIRGSNRDVTDRRKTEEALRMSEERYRLVVEKAREGIMVTQDGLIRFVNPAITDILKFSKKELVSREFTDFIHPDDRHIVLQRHKNRLKGESEPTRYSFRVVTKDGEIKWLEIDVGVVAWEERPATVVLATDITRRKHQEQALAESEQWYRSLVENSFDGIFVQKGSRIIFANHRLHEMLGYDDGELEGMEHWSIYDGEYQSLARQRALARMKGEKVVPQYEVKLKRKNGSSFFGEISARRITVRDEAGIEVWIRDVSKRINAQTVQRRLATAVEQAAETIVITDVRGKILYANPSFQRVTGYSREEALGKNPRLLSSGQHDPAFYRELWRTISKGNSWSGKFVNKRKDGSLYHEDATISPVKDSFGKIVNYVAVKRDITSEMLLQQQLIQAQKMEAIGTLAGGIAHDFNNLLQVILGFTRVVLWAKSEDDPERANLQKVYDAGKRGADLVKSLLTFSRQQPTEFRLVNLNQETLNIQKLLTRTIPKNIKIDLRLSGELDAINADITQVGQVLMNLALNARDAMPDGGALTIETRNLQLDEDYCRSNPEVIPGNYVLLRFSDTGCGMDQKAMDNMFHPFFTTKELGKGTGLGLATVYGIVAGHKGHIKCFSQIGQGTTFEIYFPVANKQEHVEPEKCFSDIQGGTETVLLVEDEEFVRDLASSLLIDFGYEVLTASNGKEALNIYQRDMDRIDLVILDLLMPEIDGRQCLDRILKMNPGTKVIIASGYSADGTPDRMLKEGARAFLDKPYDAMLLLQTVRKILDQTDGT